DFVFLKMTGVAYPAISETNFWTGPIPVPPRSEQQRIVAKVDQLMALCDEVEAKKEEQKATHARLNKSALQALRESRTNEDLKANWTRVQDNFRQLFTTPESVQEIRSTILQLAVKGKLVPQNPYDEPASALLEQIRKEKQRLIKEGKIKKQKALPEIKPEEVPFDLPEGWVWCCIGNIAQLITSGSRGWAKYYSDSGSIFITMSNLSQESYQLCMNSISYVRPPEGSEGSRTKLEENDLLISITGEVGKLGLIPPDFGDAYINQHTCLLRLMPSCRNRYFPEFMRSLVSGDHCILLRPKHAWKGQRTNFL
ncbi:MAG: restriction endonuclease subunit S, partial [Desulfovermiculus sp.]|nr:restriction endonuclease subunit S [Desulfovermiculus sp.]